MDINKLGVTQDNMSLGIYGMISWYNTGDGYDAVFR